MGATAAIELQKPPDASDILSSNDVEFAKSEVIRLRNELGHLAKAHGINILCMDASDIVLGKDNTEDLNRCVEEISHIRRCLRLSTQTSKRESRGGLYSARRHKPDEEEKEGPNDEDCNDSDSSSDD